MQLSLMVSPPLSPHLSSPSPLPSRQPLTLCPRAALPPLSPHFSPPVSTCLHTSLPARLHLPPRTRAPRASRRTFRPTARNPTPTSAAASSSRSRSRRTTRGCSNRPPTVTATPSSSHRRTAPPRPRRTTPSRLCVGSIDSKVRRSPSGVATTPRSWGG